MGVAVCASDRWLREADLSTAAVVACDERTPQWASRRRAMWALATHFDHDLLVQSAWDDADPRVSSPLTKRCGSFACYSSLPHHFQNSTLVTDAINVNVGNAGPPPHARPGSEATDFPVPTKVSVPIDRPFVEILIARIRLGQKHRHAG